MRLGCSTAGQCICLWLTDKLRSDHIYIRRNSEILKYITVFFTHIHEKCVTQFPIL